MSAGRGRRAQRGFTYLAALFLMLLLELALAITGEAWTVARQRSAERDLLWAGNQYARALRAYHAQSPGPRQYPVTLDELLEDRRFPVPRHHLRQLYPDPVTRGAWALILDGQGRISGVRSRSDEAPMKQAGFPPRWQDFKGLGHYSDWKFLAERPAPPSPTPALPVR